MKIPKINGHTWPLRIKVKEKDTTEIPINLPNENQSMTQLNESKDNWFDSMFKVNKIVPNLERK